MKKIRKIKTAASLLVIMIYLLCIVNGALSLGNPGDGPASREVSGAASLSTEWGTSSAENTDTDSQPASPPVTVPKPTLTAKPKPTQLPDTEINPEVTPEPTPKPDSGYGDGSPGTTADPSKPGVTPGQGSGNGSGAQPDTSGDLTTGGQQGSGGGADPSAGTDTDSQPEPTLKPTQTADPERTPRPKPTLKPASTNNEAPYTDGGSDTAEDDSADQLTDMAPAPGINPEEDGGLELTPDTVSPDNTDENPKPATDGGTGEEEITGYDSGETPLGGETGYRPDVPATDGNTGVISGYITAYVNDTEPADRGGLNNNAVTPLAGYAVSLYAADNLAEPVGRTVTGTDGKYAFTGLVSGDYAAGLVSAIMNGYEYHLPTERTTDNKFAADWIDDPATAYTEPIGIYGGASVTGVNARLTQSGEAAYPNSLSGYLWLDRENKKSFPPWNGLWDDDEYPICEYTVLLYRENDFTAPAAETVTDGEGRYEFINVEPGLYMVAVGQAVMNGREYLIPMSKTEQNLFTADWQTDPILGRTDAIKVGQDTAITDVNCALHHPIGIRPLIERGVTNSAEWEAALADSTCEIIYVKSDFVISETANTTLADRISGIDTVRITTKGPGKTIKMANAAAGKRHLIIPQECVNVTAISFEGVTLDGNTSLYGTVKRGGIESYKNDDLTIIGVIIKNSQSAFGGGVFSAGTGALTLTDVTVDHCVADGSDALDDRNGKGGGVYSAGALSLFGQTNIINNSVTGGAGQGGGAYSENGVDIDSNAYTPTYITGNVLSSADGYGEGGGIYSHGAFTLKRGIINGNFALIGSNRRGGGVFANGDISIESDGNNGSGEIRGNKSGYGGGVYAAGITNSRNMKLTAGLLSGNKAEKDGGGVYLEPLRSFDMSDAEISGNEAENGIGGGIYTNGYSEFNIEESAVFKDNKSKLTGDLNMTPAQFKELIPSVRTASYSAASAVGHPINGLDINVPKDKKTVTVVYVYEDGRFVEGTAMKVYDALEWMPFKLDDAEIPKPMGNEMIKWKIGENGIWQNNKQVELKSVDENTKLFLLYTEQVPDMGIGGDNTDAILLFPVLTLLAFICYKVIKTQFTRIMER